MTISELIKELKHVKSTHGDITVWTWNDGIARIVQGVDIKSKTDKDGNVVEHGAFLIFWKE